MIVTDDKRPITAEDVYQIVYVEDPRISPDGRWIAYVQMTVDRPNNTYSRNIWLADTTGNSDPIQMTRSGKDFQPRWSPDGERLAFVSARAGGPQVYLLPVTAPGGEARQLTQMRNGATYPAWSPDGGQIAFLSSMNATEREEEDAGEAPTFEDAFEKKQHQERQQHEEEQRWDPRPVWRVPYRGNRTFWPVPPRSITAHLDDRYDQVYVVEVDGDDGTPRRLTDADADSGPPQWLPGGELIVTTRPRDSEADEPYMLHSLVTIAVESGEETQLTGDGFTDYTPLPSPDGQWIAYLRTPTTNFFASLQRLTVIPAAGGPPRDLTVEFDRAVVAFRWSADSRHLVFNAPDRGAVEIYRVPVEGGAVEKIVSGLMDTELFDVGPEGGVAFTASTPLSPPELFWQAPGADEPTQVTTANAALLDEVVVQETHEMWFTAPDGQEIQGWYILPVGYEEGQTYPLAFNIHGGPHVMWSASAKSMWHEWQFHAARGYAVFYCNPRGGDGYGAAFQDAIHNGWGEADFPDLMAGIDALLEKGFVDPERMAVTGGSYGGFMTAWVVGHTDRFAAAVSQRGVYSMLSFYGTTDIPALGTHELDAEPWEDYAKLWELSPLAYAHQIKTPLLLIHSEHDFRVPIAEAEQLFAFVRRSGGTVRMLRYPRDGHELSRSGEPKHRVSRLEEMVSWFDTYCKPE